MGQKVSPHGLRVGVIKDWGSKWYADKKDFAEFLAEDNKIRTFIKKKIYAAGVSKVVIERPGENKLKITLAVGRPGMVIGRSGEGVDQLKKDLEKLTGKNVNLDINEVRKAELDAQLTAESIAMALEKRTSHRRAMKQAISKTILSGAKGIKVLVSGRLNGAEIARDEKYSEGNVPLHTLRTDIDYGFAEADTTFGKLGVKVWINHGERLDKELQSVIKEEKKSSGRRKDARGDRKKDRRKGGDRRRSDRRNAGRNERDFMPKAANKRVRPKKAEPAPVEESQDAAEVQTEEVKAEE